MSPCEDNYTIHFSSYGDMLAYHEKLSKASKWERSKVSDLVIFPLDENSPLYGDLTAFASDVSEAAIQDTAKNLGLAVRINGQLYPLRSTAYKSLLDRAKIGGTALPKLNREVLANTLNACLALYKSEALLLVRDEKVAAAHSGDAVDYSVLPIDELLTTLQNYLERRFTGNRFDVGFPDHAFSCASWTFPDQKDDLLGVYAKTLAAQGKAPMAAKIVPGIRFITSDTGVASAKISALLMGTQHPIHIGGCVAVDHRHKTTIGDFEKVLDQLFAQFADSVAQLQHLLEIDLQYPVNAMTRVCKKLSLPKKEAVEAIAMFEMSLGTGPVTAHDVFIALQEIPFLLKAHHAPESKMVTVEENMARALTLNWSNFDLAKAVDY